MAYDPTWIRISPILTQSIKNEAITAQKGSVRLNSLSWGQKVGSTSLDTNQGGSQSISLTPLNNGKIFVAWGTSTGDGRFAIVNSDGVLDSTSYQVFESGGFLDYEYGLGTTLLSNGNIVIAYGQDQGVRNAIVFKIYNENGDLVRDVYTSKTHATETNWAVGLTSLPDGDFVLTWNEAASGLTSYYAIYNQEGDIIKGNVSLGGNYARPKPTAMSDGNWIVTYESGSNLYFQTYNRQGTQLVSETLFKASVSQAPGLTSLPNGQILVPFTGGFGILDRFGNVILTPELRDTTGTYAITVLPYGGIVAQNNVDATGYYTVYDSNGNVIGAQASYSTDMYIISAGDVATFKDGSFFLAYIATTSNSVKFFIHQGTKAGFAGDLQVDGALSFDTGASISQFSTDTSLSANSDSIVPTQKAIKTYVDQFADHTQIFDNDTRVKVSDSTSGNSNATVTIDGTDVAVFNSLGLTLISGAVVSSFSNDYTLGGYNGASGNTDIVSTEYAARKYLDDITGTGGMSEPTGYPYGNNDLITTLGVDSSNIVYIEPVGSYFDVFLAGQRWRITSRQEVTISDVEGLHYIYFDNDGVLKEATTFSSSYLYSRGYTAVCYWDAVNKEIIYFGDERHGCTMDGRTHANIHTYRGTLYVSGLALGDITADSTGALDIDAQFSVEYGEIRDEDISHPIATAPFTGYTLPATLPMFYLDGTSEDWRYEINTNFAVLNRGSGRVAWNELSGSSWGLTEASDSYYVLTHVFATNDHTKKIVGIVGQNQYSNISAARIGATNEINSLIIGVLPFAEFVPIATIIFQTSNLYTNSVKAVVVSTDEGSEWVDWRLSGLSAQPGSITSHSSLFGLSHDDHPQYLLVDGSRAMTGSLTLLAGIAISEFSSDVTLSGDSDSAVPTEHAVKTYVDSALSGVQSNKISQGDSYVQVSDDQTSAGHVDIVVDGTTVAYFDALASSIRIGKDSETNLVITDTLANITNGNLKVGEGDDFILLDRSGVIEVCDSGGSARLDLKNSAAEDFDSRIIQVGTSLIFYTGGDSVYAAMILYSSNDLVVPNGNITAGTGDTAVIIDNAGGIEISKSGGTGYIDFKSLSASDYDCRIIQNSNGLDFYTGGNGSTSLGLSINSSQGITLSTGATITEFSTDGTLGDNSDTAVPTEQAVKTYIDSQAVSTRVDNWTLGNTFSNTGNWEGLAWSPELGIFVGVSNLGDIMSSPDGINWTLRAEYSSRDWTGIVWSPELGIFAAVSRSITGGPNGGVVTSPDGINWTERNGTTFRYWEDITWSPELGIFVAVGNTPTGDGIMTSPDGINWTQRTSPVASTTWYGVTWAPEISTFVAVTGGLATDAVMYSSDGTTWTSADASTGQTWRAVAWSPELNLFAAVASSGLYLMTSPDGVTWTTRFPPQTGVYYSIVWSSELSLFVTVAYSGTDRVMTSPDGITWTARDSADDTKRWYSVAWSPELGIFAALPDSASSTSMYSQPIDAGFLGGQAYTYYKNKLVSWRGEWSDSTTAFTANEFAIHNGVTYIATDRSVPSSTNEPGFGVDWESYWDVFASGGLHDWQLIDSNVTAVSLDRLAVDTTSTAVTVTLPSSPVFGDEVTVVDRSGTFSSNNCTLGRNSELIEGLAEDYVLDIDRADVHLVYVGGDTGWRVISGVV